MVNTDPFSEISLKTVDLRAERSDPVASQCSNEPLLLVPKNSRRRQIDP